MKIDWAKKLSSRKFWSMVAAFVSSMIAFFGGAESVAVQVTSLIVCGGAIVSYILTEGKVDAAGAQAGASKSAYEAPTATVEDDEDDCYGMTD